MSRSAITTVNSVYKLPRGLWDRSRRAKTKNTFFELRRYGGPALGQFFPNREELQD